MARAERGPTRTRLVSALVLAPPALLCVWLGGGWFAALVIAAAAIMGWEWARLTGVRSRVVIAAVILAASLPAAAMAFGASVIALALVAVGVIGTFLLARGSAGATVWTALGTAWIALPCLGCVWLDRGAGRGAVLWLFVTVWATDSSAFVVGRRIGGPRLAPALSPNKTWSGFAGGVIAAALVSGAVALVAPVPILALVAAGTALCLAAQGGDLAESLAKRHFGVKDASSLIPGHGGLLDRLDGMLAAAAIEWALTYAGVNPFLWPG